MKRISLIIPVWNGEKWLQKMADSVLQQDWENLQVIFSDNGSDDGSGEILRKLQEKDSRVTVISGGHDGVSNGRNRALAIADGDFIGFADSDDTLMPGFLRTLAETLEQQNADCVCCGFKRIYESSGKEELLPLKRGETETTDREGFLVNILRPDGYTAVIWNKLFRREALLEPDGSLMKFNPAYHIVEDGEFLFRTKVQKIVFLPQPLYCYYVRNSGAMYGRVSEKKLTEVPARKAIAGYAAEISPQVRDLARMKYQKSIRDLMFHALMSGDFSMVRHLMPELKTWTKEMFASPYLFKKEKLKYHAYYFIIRLRLKHVGRLMFRMFSGH